MAHPLVEYHQVSLISTGSVPGFELNAGSRQPSDTPGYWSVLADSDLGEFDMGTPQLDYDEAVSLNDATANVQLNARRGGLVTATIPVMYLARQPSELHGKIENLKLFLRQNDFYLEYTRNLLYAFSPSGSTWPDTFPYDFARTNATNCTATSSKFQIATSGDTAERAIYYNTQSAGSGRVKSPYGTIFKCAGLTQLISRTAGTMYRGKLWVWDTGGGMVSAPNLSAAITSPDASPVYSEKFVRITDSAAYELHYIVLDVVDNPNTLTAQAYSISFGPSERYLACASQEPKVVIDGGYWAPGAGGSTSPLYRARLLIEVLHNPLPVIDYTAA